MTRDDLRMAAEQRGWRVLWLMGDVWVLTDEAGRWIGSPCATPDEAWRGLRDNDIEEVAK